MKPILWVFAPILYIAFSANLAFSAPAQTNEVNSSQSSVLSALEGTETDLDRSKRASRTGQTQSQYLNFGDSQTEGKADAEITRYGSRASVSGSNGMGQAQSQSSGTGCDECLGNENSNGYSYGAPDPLRSSSGTTSGLPQSQSSSLSPSIPQISTGSGYDAYGRPTNGPNIGSSGYTSQGFGPGGNRPLPSDRLKDVYSNGYTSGSDSHPNAPSNVGPNSGSLTDRNAGTPSTNGRGPSVTTLGSDSFLNRPVNPNSGQSNQNGKTSGSSSPNENGRPSIQATRRPNSSGSGPGKLIDASNDGNTRNNGNSHGTYTPSTDHGGGSLNGRQPHQDGRRHGTGPSSSNYGNTNAGSPDNSAQNKNSPIRSGTYDSSVNGRGGHSDGDKAQNGNNLQPYDQTRNRNPSGGKETSDSGSPSGPQSTDSLSGFRNVFKLPPGLCLVKCETLRPGQALTSDQIRDAFVSSGLNVPETQYPQSGISSNQNLPSAPTVPAAPPISIGQGAIPSSPYPQTPSVIGSNVYPQYPSPSQSTHGSGSYPSTGQYPQGGISPSQNIPSVPSVPAVPSIGQGSNLPSGSYQVPPNVFPSTSYPQTPSIIAPSVYPQYQSTPGQSGGQYPQGGISPSQNIPSVPSVPAVPSISQGSNLPSGSYQVPPNVFPSTSYPQTLSISAPAQIGLPGQMGIPNAGQPYPAPGQVSASGAGSQIGSQFQQPGNYPQNAAGQQGGGASYLPQYPASYPQTPSISGPNVYSQYPSSSQITPGSGQQYPGQASGQFSPQQPSAAQIAASGAGGQIGSQYPTSGQIPVPSVGQQYPSSGQIPASGAGGQIGSQYPTSGQFSPQQPSAAQIAASGAGGQIGSQYPTSGQIPVPSVGQQYPSTGQIPASGAGGQIGSQYPTSGQITASGAGAGGQIGSQYPTSDQIPASAAGGQIGSQYPTSGQFSPQQPSAAQIPASGAGGQIGSQYPTSGQIPIPSVGQQYPSSGQIPISGPNGQIGSQYQQGNYPQNVAGQQGGGASYLPQYPGQQAGNYATGGQYQPGNYPQNVAGQQGGGGSYLPQYPGQQGGTYVNGGDTTGAQTSPANYVSGSESGSSGSSGSLTAGEDDGYSQAESSIKNGEVIASAQGTKNGGTAQTQVQGTYSGSGSFSASAQTADKERSAQAQVSGHKDGALSSSQGSGGKSQAQAQVEVNEKTGSTSATGQTSGQQHSSQSEVTANEKGGLADAQSSGPGQTSSQAQIGFRPESGANNQIPNPFNGGGQASAQSGVHSGQSQSQIHGNFKYGISYHGAAQAASGTKEQVISYREKSKKLFQSIGQFSRSNRDAVTSSAVSDIANINDIGAKPKTPSIAPDPAADDSFPEDADYEADEGDDEYDEDDDAIGTKTNDTKTKSSRMEVHLPRRINLTNSARLAQVESTTSTIPTSTFTPTISSISTTAKSLHLPAVRSETVPDGFKGKIDDKRQKTPIPKNQIHRNQTTTVDVKPDSYVTVTKSVSGSLDSAKSTPTDDKKFESTYYTKSSTCGYFTFSCNIVYGSNGRSKICRKTPKTPANGKC